MKQFYLLIAATLMSVTMSAQSSKQMMNLPVNVGTVSKHHARGTHNMVVPMDETNKPVFPVKSTEIISEANPPQGEEITALQRSGMGLFPKGYGVSADKLISRAWSYIKGDDGCIYLKQPFSKAYTFSYLKLEPLDKDTFIARMPQAIEYEDYAQRVNYISRMIFDTTTSQYVLDADATYEHFNSDMKFVLEDGVLRMVTKEPILPGQAPKEIIGLVSPSGEWLTYGDAEITIEPFNETLMDIPSDLNPEWGCIKIQIFPFYL